MKRNNIINSLYAIGIGLCCLISSCQKSLLNQTPPTQLSDASYWANTTDLQNYVNYFYSSTFNKYTGSGVSLYQFGDDNNSDNMVPSGYNKRNNGEYTLANAGNPAWTSIYKVNYFLVNYSRVYSQGVTPAQAAPFVGEAYFFRAMLYFNGLQSYGALPWINKPLNVNDSTQLYSARLPRNIITDSIVQDLNNAIALLPTKSNAQAMRIYREYAQAFKSRVCLYEGTWEKYHATDSFGVAGQNGTKYLQMAASAADSVINSGTFALANVGTYNGYWKLFNQLDYTSSKEVIFWGADNITNGGGNVLQNVLQEALGGSSGISKSLVDDYLCTDGKPTSASPLYKGDDSLIHVVANRDPRLSQTIFLPGDTMANTTPLTIFTYPALLTSSSPNSTGYQLFKGLNPDPSLDTHTGYAGATCGIIYMRYAEVLLNSAEAKAELGTIAQTDIDATINKLRTRVGMPPLVIALIINDPKWLFPSLSPIINEVRRERRVELACEGFRFNDICRWAAAGTLIKGTLPLGATEKQWATVSLAGGKLVVGSNVFVSNGYISPYGNTSQMTSGYKFNLNRDYLLPYNITDVTINSNIKQNPGW